MSNNELYASGVGDSLVNETNYPDEIKEYLKAEENLMIKLAYKYDLLIEIGAMYGRWVKWAAQRDMSYLGVEPVERYVIIGNNNIICSGLDTEKYRIIQCSCENFPTQKNIYKTNNSIIILPFNAFGNITDPNKAINSLISLNIPFVISTYLTNSKANNIRYRYYLNCKYQDMQILNNSIGVHFITSEGFKLSAYNDKYFEHLFKDTDLLVSRFKLGEIGVGYYAKLCEKR